MRNTHTTLLAYGKGAVAAIAMVTGTAVMMSAFSPAEAPLKGYSQNKLAQNTFPLVNISNIESVNGKQYQQMPDATDVADVQVTNPS